MRALPAIVLLLALAPAPAIADEARDAAIVSRALDGYVRPAVTDFAEKAGGLEKALSAFCAEPGPATRQPVDAAFRAAVEGWSEVQFLRFGPLVEANRLERIAFWPDPKGIGLRQIRRALADRDPSVSDPAQLADKSVALQGLTAIEYLLYSDDGEAAGAPGEAGAFRCAYAAAAAASLADVAAAIAAEWADRDGFASRLLQPGPEDPLYRTPSEAVAELHSGFTTGLQVTQDQKLKPVLGDSMDAARPLAAPFRRSGLTLAVLDADLRAFKAFAAAADFTRGVAEADRWIGGSMAFEFDNAIAAVEAIALPIDEAVYDRTARGKLEYLFVVLGNLRSLTQQDLGAALGLSGGFNALDGD